MVLEYIELCVYVKFFVVSENVSHKKVRFLFTAKRMQKWSLWWQKWRFVFGERCQIGNGELVGVVMIIRKCKMKTRK